tara:strand:- start:255 stop:1040 length:786 start_codon:yes stop_codon:yes gene_type:complete
MHPQVEKLLKLPQYEQRSPEWYAARKGKLTASDVPTVLGENHYKSPFQLHLDKLGMGKPFTGNEATRWGQHYEDIAIAKYEQVYNKKNHEFGLIPHPTIPWLGGSPDGITEDGILLEVKCPLRRQIKMGEVPQHYIGQVLMNLEVCELETAHFIEYKPGDSDDDYIMNVVEIKRDPEWWKRSLPIMQKWHEDWMLYKEEGIEKHPQWTKYYNQQQTAKKNREIKDKGTILNFLPEEQQENIMANDWYKKKNEWKSTPQFLN